MGRSLLFAKLTINNEVFQIGTTHLESLNNAVLREKQLNISFQAFDLNAGGCCFMGDFNFDWPQENKKININYDDVWPLLNDISQNPGHTMKKSQHFPAWRPDRFCLRKHKQWKAKKIQIIGTEPIPLYSQQNIKQKFDYEILTPSDHFGLFIELECMNIEQKK